MSDVISHAPPRRLASARSIDATENSEKQASLAVAPKAEPAPTEAPALVGPVENLGQELNAESSTSAPLAFDPNDFSRLEISPELRKAVPDAKPSGPELEAPREPKTWLGVFIACLLGAVPIIALVLVRSQASVPDGLATPMEVTEMGTASANEVSAPERPAIAEAEPEPEGFDARRESPVSRVTGTSVARTNGAPASDFSKRTRAAQPNVTLAAPLTSPSVSQRSPAAGTSAPVRTSWFHR